MIFIKNKNKTVKAFTLVELLLAMSLTILVGGVIYLLQSSAMRSVKRGTTRLTLSSVLRNKIEQMVSELRCTKEIINISNNSIKIRCYKFSTENPDPGDTALVTITYEIEKSGGKYVMWKTVNRSNPIKLFSVQKINEDVFHPYYQTYDPHSPVKWAFYPFDTISNDSGKRKKISYIQLKFIISNFKESVSIVTGVKLRPLASIIKQPHWKYR